MRSHRTSKASRSLERGFTLLELLVVMSIMTTVGGLSLVVSMDGYRGFAFRGERDALVAALCKARSQSVNNMCFGSGCTDGTPHGVHIESGKYVIFQGTSYATRVVDIDEVLNTQYAAAHLTSPSVSEIVFVQLSGDVAIPSEIGLTDDAGHISTTSINAEGRVSWTN